MAFNENVPVRNFNDFLNIVLESNLGNEKLLPLTHIPNSYSMPIIADEKELKVFKENKNYENEELAFFSYGRNVYLNSSRKDLGFEANPPFVFLFNPRKIPFKPIRLLPFDSGGFDKYGLPQQIPLKRYEINEPECKDMVKLVFLLYKNYNNYLDYRHDFEEMVMKFRALFPEIMVLNEFYRRLTTLDTTIREPARTIEIQYNKPIPLDPILILYPHIYDTPGGSLPQIRLGFPKIPLQPYQTVQKPSVDLETINSVIKDFIQNSDCNHV